MISFISKKDNDFLKEIEIFLKHQKIKYEVLNYNRVKLLPKWLKFYLSQKEICFLKFYIKDNKEVQKKFFSFEPLECADIYYIDSFLLNKEYSFFSFYKNIKQKTILKNIKNAKLITSSNGLKKHLIKEFNLDSNNIDVIYKSFNQKKINFKKAKEEFILKHELNETTKFILFKGNDFINDGGKEFLEIFSKIEYDNLNAIFVGPKKQIEGFKFIARKLNIIKKVLFINEENFSDDIFVISDIYLYPTYKKRFSLDLIKAMYYKNAVFIPNYNFGSELVDVYSLIENPNDFATIHKIDALLNDNNSLEEIKLNNHNCVKNFNISKSPILNYLN